MKTKFFIITLIIFLASCKSEKEIDVIAWNEITSEMFNSELNNFENDSIKNLGKSYVFGLIDRREKIINSLDSVIQFKNPNKIETIERYSLGITIFYSMKVKIDENEYLLKYFGDKITVENSESTNSFFNGDHKEICKKKHCGGNLFIDNISVYTSLEFDNKISVPKKICVSMSTSNRVE